jgi:hypothetical protein
MQQRWIGTGGNEWMGMSEQLPLKKEKVRYHHHGVEGV